MGNRHVLTSPNLTESALMHVKGPFLAGCTAVSDHRCDVFDVVILSWTTSLAAVPVKGQAR